MARFGFAVLLVAALVSAGVIFGRPYLFPTEWDEQVLIYSEPVASIRGVEFTEPFTISTLPSAEHRNLVFDRLFSSLDNDLATWRALGLAAAH